MTSFSTQLLQNAVASGLVVASGVEDLFPSNNAMMQNVKMGGAIILAEDAVSYFNGNGSLIMSLNGYELLDRVFFASSFYAALSKVGATRRIINALDGLSPLPETVNDALVDAGLTMINRTLSDLLEQNPTVNSTPLRYVVHPSYIVRGG